MKRYCRTCGKVEEDDLRVLCSACGGMLIPGKEFVFRGCKGEIPLTYVEVKETESRIELTETELQIAQTVTWFDAVKRPSVSINIPYAEIQGIEQYYRWDWWDLAIAAGLTAVTQVSHWAWFLLILLFLYLGVGRDISIYYKNGSVWRIPVGVDLFGKGNSAFAEQFMQEVRGRVPKGVA